MTHALPESVDRPLLIHGDSFGAYVPQTDAGRGAMRMLGVDPLLEKAADLLFGLSLSERLDGLPAQADAGRLAEQLRGPKKPAIPRWAVGFVAFLVDVWSETDRTLKPGAFVCAWALPKTADPAGLAMRIVGWTVHDSLLHLFGTGMAKAGDIGKKIDKAAGAERDVIGLSGTCTGPSQATGMLTSGVSGEAVRITAPATDEAKRWTGWSSQLAPGHEQWILGRKPTRLTYAEQVLTHGCGALHIDACRTPTDWDTDPTRRGWQGGNSREDWCGATVGITASSFPGHKRVSAPSSLGRWPRNVVLTTGGEECPAEGLDAQSGVQRDGVATNRNRGDVRPMITAGAPSLTTKDDVGYGGGGGASRYFTRFDQRVGYFPKASDRRAGVRRDFRNDHPTHKHPGLMRWLVRLLAATAERTGGQPAIVLDMFMGSGTTGVAAVAEGVRFVGIERDPVDVRITAEHGGEGAMWAEVDACSLAGEESIACDGEPGCFVTEAPLCSAEIHPGALSYYIARSRIMAAIGSPKAAAVANAQAPKGAQLGLL